MLNEKNEIIESILLISIPTFEDKYVENSKVTFYQIRVFDNYNKTNWIVEKRYNDFYNLYCSLYKLFPNCPSIPGKSLFKFFSYDSVNTRRQDLELFLENCLMRKDIMTSDLFRCFIEIDKHSPEIITFKHEQISKTPFDLGIRDFVYLKELSLAFVAMSEMSLKSRLSAYFNNNIVNEFDEIQAVGIINAYSVIEAENSSLEFNLLWTKAYPIQVYFYIN